MKRWLRSIWLWLVALLVVAGVGTFLYLRLSVDNVMHPALDKLSAVPYGQRWSHPEMLKIRDRGVEAVSPLRRVLREKENPAIHLLLWVKTNSPWLAKHYSHFPDANKLAERRSMACQVLETLGPAGKPAAPELVEILRGKDLRDLNSAASALHAVGIDAEICERLDALMEQGVPPFACSQIVSALGQVKPPSARTLRALTAALTNANPFVQERAAETLGDLGVGTPKVISGLKQLQSASNNGLVLVAVSTALWDLERDSASVSPRVLEVLENELVNFAPVSGPGNGGQAVSASEQTFMMAGFLFQRMKPGEPERSRALALLESACEKSDRIFIRMLLLSPMIELGFPEEKALAVCREGLRQQEDYYRIQAAQLLGRLDLKHDWPGIDLEALVHDPDVNVRVYASKVHWLKNRQAKAVVPVLTESLDRSKHQSYYFAQSQPAALTLLGDIGPEAKEAVGELEKTLHDPNPNVVKLASEALAKIRR